ncbi:MAG: aldo/keto reductase [Oscillospiraceae bacterium]|nr:aldo/keto reductase [Oscillospiraceae bacterium]
MADKKLAFGMMRLPLTDPADSTAIDYATVNTMVDSFMSKGFTHFDTAAPYHKMTSEVAFRECVAKRYPRESYTVTDKLTLGFVEKNEDLEPFFAGQLERCGVEYFDYYWLHAMSETRAEQMEAMGGFAFIREKKAQGKIRHIGLSFHDSADALDKILTNHPELEYVQLQLNYLDWEDDDVQSRKCYEVCCKHGKPVMVMEPVKGGVLANLIPEAEALLKKADPHASCASWAIRFAASLDNVCMVLSGMSSPEQMEDNLSYMEHFKPLTQAEIDLLAQVVEVIHSKATISCTACRYCVDGCPMGIAIPDYFALMNDLSKFGETRLGRNKQRYARLTVEGGKGLASVCVACGQCEGQCPQHLPIIEYLKDVATTFE